jgi:hypothetical protein
MGIMAFHLTGCNHNHPYHGRQEAEQPTLCFLVYALS